MGVDTITTLQYLFWYDLPLSLPNHSTISIILWLTLSIYLQSQSTYIPNWTVQVWKVSNYDQSQSNWNHICWNWIFKKESVDIVENFLDIIKETLVQGENLKLSGFGSFNLRDKRARTGRNSQTGGPMTITPRRVLTFRASNVFRDKLNCDNWN